MRLLIIAALISCSMMPALPALAWQDEGVIDYDKDDVAMNAARTEARASLPQFLDMALTQELSDHGHMVKYAHRYGESGHEHIWVTLTKIEGTMLSGFYANQPKEFDANLGDDVQFDAAEVSDWGFWDDAGKLHGNFTTRVMLKDLPAEDANELRAILAPLPKGDRL